EFGDMIAGWPGLHEWPQDLCRSDGVAADVGVDSCIGAGLPGCQRPEWHCGGLTAQWTGAGGLTQPHDDGVITMNRSGKGVSLSAQWARGCGGAKVQAAGSDRVAADSVTRLVQRCHEESGERVRMPLIVSERLQDLCGHRVVAVREG